MTTLIVPFAVEFGLPVLALAGNAILEEFMAVACMIFTSSSLNLEAAELLRKLKFPGERRAIGNRTAPATRRLHTKSRRLTDGPHRNH